MSQRDGYLKDDLGFEFSTDPASRLSETWTQDRRVASSTCWFLEHATSFCRSKK